MKKIIAFFIFIMLISSFVMLNKQVDLWYLEVRKTDFLKFSSTICQTDNSIFYITDKGIKKYNTDIKNSQLILKELDIDALYIYGGELFYLQSYNNKSSQCIYKININSINNILHYKILPELVLQTKGMEIDWIKDFLVTNEQVYFESDPLTWYNYNINNNKPDIIEEEINKPAFLDNYIYYIENTERTFSIFEKSLLTGEISLMRGNGQSRNNTDNIDSEMYDGILSVENELYYTTRFPFAVHKYNGENEDKDDEIFSLTNYTNNPFIYLYTDNKKLYYAYSLPESSYLLSYTPKTKENILIAKINDFRPNLSFAVFDNVLFYYGIEDEDMKYLKLNKY